ncbi:glycosyltransferase family 2 protein, partial [bacterium]|nr:glycosyltransferase family 2 protein [bacterium]
MSHRFSIAAIIVRYAKDSKIADCLASLRSSTRPPDEVCVIDNRPSDGLIDAMRSQFPQMNVFGQKHNIGFAAGCNEGIRRTQSDLLLILNDDSYLHRECIERLAREFDDTPRLAACQPKILAAADHEMFEYAGCSGGFLDMFGVPFLRGRILDTVERDCGQYGDVREILWASGAAFMMSRSVLSDVGLFDEVFFAHMEEIDLCWRMHLMAYLVKVIPDAVAYHFGGGTLAYESPLKTFFNYRNNWRMLLKNFSLWPLVVVIPARLALDLC